MMQKTSKSLKTIKFNSSFISLSQIRLKKRTGRIGNKKEILKVWKNWLEEYVIKQLLAGKKVKIGEHACIYVQGTPLLKSNSALRLRKNGKCLNRRGELREVEFNNKRKDVVYEVVYENKLTNNKLYFDTAPTLSKRLHKSLTETNTYYNICNNK